MRILRWVVPAVAVAILALMLIPAQVWKAPADDAVYHGFDRNLMYSTGGGGVSVRVTSSLVDIHARPNGRPSINLATTLQPRMEASASVAMLSNAHVEEPRRIT